MPSMLISFGLRRNKIHFVSFSFNAFIVSISALGHFGFVSIVYWPNRSSFGK